MRKALHLTVDDIITEIDLDAAPAGELALLQGLVHGRIEVLPLTSDVSICIDEEGKYSGAEMNRVASALFTMQHGIFDPIMGDVVFLGEPDDEGVTLGLPDDLYAALDKLIRNIVTVG